MDNYGSYSKMKTYLASSIRLADKVDKYLLTDKSIRSVSTEGLPDPIILRSTTNCYFIYVPDNGFAWINKEDLNK
jgi:hypothetical protein